MWMPVAADAGRRQQQDGSGTERVHILQKCLGTWDERRMEALRTGYTHWQATATPKFLETARMKTSEQMPWHCGRAWVDRFKKMQERAKLSHFCHCLGDVCLRFAMIPFRCPCTDDPCKISLASSLSLILWLNCVIINMLSF